MNTFRSRRFYGKLLVGGLLMVGMAGGWAAMQRQQAAAEGRVANQIEELGGRVYLDYQWHGRRPVEDAVPNQPRWMRWLFGDEIFARFVAVDLTQVEEMARVADLLPRLTSVRYVAARGSALSDEQMVVFSRMGNLVHLDLSATTLSDTGLEHLARLVRLETLNLAGTAVSDDGLSSLDQLRRLRELDLRGTRVTVAGATRFARQRPPCRIVGP